ncbi:hypothetical protein [Streptomyces sp. NPDC046909]|uniref:hypothetical protein n=1 Tax=Streptomyces sp. NPDC046909 TaxID=3155617 RepID=UPI0033F09DC8
MQEITDAAVGFPTVMLTVSLVVVTGFWLLVLLSRAQRDGLVSAAGADLPVAAAATLVIALAWVFSLGGSVLLLRPEISGPVYAVLAVAVLAGSMVLAYGVARMVMRLR